MILTPRPDIPGTYWVQSGEKVYNVDLRDPYSPTCDCADHIWRDTICKHITACQRYRDGETDGLSQAS